MNCRLMDGKTCRELTEANERAEKAEALLKDSLATQDTMLRQKKQLGQENKRLRELMQWFVDRCEKGEVRSKRTYEAFKQALKKERA